MARKDSLYLNQVRNFSRFSLSDFCAADVLISIIDIDTSAEERHTFRRLYRQLVVNGIDFADLQRRDARFTVLNYPTVDDEVLISPEEERWCSCFNQSNGWTIY